LFGFVTEPFIAPVVFDWAIALSAQIATSTKLAKQNRRALHITGELLKEIKIVETKLRAIRRAQTLTEESENVLDCLFRRKSWQQAETAVSIMTNAGSASRKPAKLDEVSVNDLPD